VLGRINRIISLFLVVALFVYIVIINANPIRVFITPQNFLTASAGVFLIGAFWIGVFFAGTIAAVFGIKAHFRERRLHAQERLHRTFLDNLLNARSFSASHEWARAQAEWQRLAARDPTAILARLELAHCLQEIGEKKEALRILDQARAAQPENSEVLLRAAELNLELGNKTAAIDNLALVLYHRPNRRAAALARDLSRELGRLEDALEYQRQLEDLGDESESGKELRTCSEYQRIISAYQSDPTNLRDELRAFTKHSLYEPALEKLAELEQAAGDSDQAAQALLKLARLKSSAAQWGRVVNFWLSCQLPDRALAAWKLAVRELSSSEQIKARQELVRLYLNLNMLEEARRELDGLQPGLKANAPVDQLSKNELILRQIALEGLYFYKRGAYDRSAAFWNQIFEPETELGPHSISGAFQSANGPSPALSTP